LWKEKEAVEQARYNEMAMKEETRLQREIEERTKDRDIKLRKVLLEEQKLDFDKQKLCHKIEKEQREIKLREQQQQLEMEERRSQIRQQEALIKLLSKNI